MWPGRRRTNVFAFLRVEHLTTGAVEEAHITQEESCQTQSTTAGALRNSRIKHKLPGAGRPTWDPEILSIAEIGAPFVQVITQGFGPIVYPLELLLGLQQRTVTIVNLQTKSKSDIITIGPIHNH